MTSNFSPANAPNISPVSTLTLTPLFTAFAFAVSAAAGEMSVAVTLAPVFAATATAIAPLPVHRSSTLQPPRARTSSMTFSASSSVSGRGISTEGATEKRSP